MATERTLTAILSGRGNLKKTLGGIADKSEDVSKSMASAAGSASSAAKAFDKSSDKGDKLSRTLKSVAGNATIVAEGLDIAEDSAQETGNEFVKSAEKIDRNTDKLKANAAAALAASTAQKVLGSSVDHAGDEMGESSREATGYSATLASLAGMSALSELGDGPDIDTRTSFFSGAPFDFESVSLKSIFGGRDTGFSFKDTLKNALPSKEPLAETVEEARELANQIERIADANPKIKAELEGIESFRSLRKRLSKLDLKSIDRLDLGDRDKSVRGLFDQLLDNGPPVDALTENFDDIDFDTRKRTIPVGFDFPDVDLRKWIPESWTTVVSFDKDRDTDIRSWLPDSLSLPVRLDIDRSPLRRLRDTLRGVSMPTIGLRGKLSGVERPDGDMDLPGPTPVFNLGSIIPNLPDIDFSGLTRGFTSIGRSADGSVGPVRELFGGISLFLGTTNEIAGLKSIAGTLGKLGGSGAAISSLGGVATALTAFAGIGTIIGAIISLTGAITGFVTALGSVGAITAGILGVGLFKKGEQLARNSKDIKNAWEGMAAYAKSFQDEVKKALNPIFNLPTGDFLEGFIGGGLDALADFSVLTERSWPGIDAMFDRLGEKWGKKQPAFFANLEELIATYLPQVEGFFEWFIRGAPGALAFMTDMEPLLTKTVDMFSSMWGALEPFLPAGAAFMSILFDLGRIIFEILTPISELIAIPLTPTLQGIAWGIGLVADSAEWASNGLSGMVNILNRWIGAIWEATTSLEFGRVEGLFRNLTLGLLETLANAFVAGINGFYKLVLKFIKKIPGAKQAIAAMNKASQAAGQGKAIPDSLGIGNVSFDGAMADLQPRKPGKQTTPGRGRGGRQGNNQQPYNNGDTNIDITINGGDGLPSKEANWRRMVKRAYHEAERQKRLRNSRLSG